MLLESETKIEPDLRLPFDCLGMHGLINVCEYDSAVEDWFDRGVSLDETQLCVS